MYNKDIRGVCMAKSYHIEMSEGNLLKNILLFSIPLMLTTLLQMLFNAADTIVVGKFSGATALAAVGATGSLIFFLVSFFNGIAAGTNVVVSKYIGAQNKEKTVLAVHTSMWVACFTGIVLTLIGIFISKPLLQIMATPEDLLPLSTIYMQIYFGGIIFTLIYDFGTAVLRSSGDTKRPLYFLTLSGALNVVLNLLFVIVFQLSVVGVALATVIAQAVSAVLTVYTLMHETNDTRFNVHQMHYDNACGKEILQIGIPAGIQGIVFSFSNIVVQSSINGFHNNNIIAGNAAAINLENFVYIGMESFSKATATFTAANVGAGKYDQLKKILWITMVLNVCSGFLVSVVLYMNGTTFLGFYTNEADVAYYGMYRLGLVTLLLPIQGIGDSFIGSLRGMGYSSFPTIMMLIGICGVRLVWLWLVFPLFGTLEMVYMCFSLSWAITAIIEGFIWLVCQKKFINE